MADLPGSVGWPLLGDKSLDFYKDPVKFVEKYIEQYKSRVFASRFLNKATVFVCSNQGVQEVLADQDDSFDHGYKAYMEQIFGENILFTDGDEAYMFRDALAHLFTSEAVQSYQDTVHRIVEKHVTAINPRKALCLYWFFKEVVTEICLTLFLGLDFSEAEEAAAVVNHTISHWHGIVSVPVQLRIPGTCNQSAYCRAMQSKKELLRVIRRQRGKAPEGFVRRMQEFASEEEDMFINNHLLLFTSALVPKAISSLLTSFFIGISRPQLLPLQPELLRNKELRSNMFREVQRMFPPFMGGRRVAKKDVVIDGYKIPADYAVVYMTGAAHRDPAVFADPHTFNHDRWRLDRGISEDNLFGFGYGPRRCIGQKVVWTIIDEVVTQLLSRYTLTLKDKQDYTQKHLPVSRPKGIVMVNLRPVASGPGTGDTSSVSDVSAVGSSASAVGDYAASAVETSEDSSPGGSAMFVAS